MWSFLTHGGEVPKAASDIETFENKPTNRPISVKVAKKSLNRVNFIKNLEQLFDFYTLKIYLL
jgi:hypothetical protein